MGLDFSYFNNLIKSTISTENNNIKRVVIVDNNGTKIADSSLDKNNNVESFKKLQRFQNAKNGESGLLTEDVSGKKMSISYTPIKFAQTNWIILLLSSNN